MFCSKCGNELNNGDRFCQYCGTKLGTSENNANTNISSENIRDMAFKIKDNFINGSIDLGKNKMLLFGNVALLFLSMIFAMTPLFKVSSLFNISESAAFGGGVLFFIAICYLVSIFCILIPLLFRKAWKPIFFLPGKITTIVFLICFFIFYFTGISETESSAYSSMAEFSLTATGWLYLIKL